MKRQQAWGSWWPAGVAGLLLALGGGWLGRKLPPPVQPLAVTDSLTAATQETGAVARVDTAASAPTPADTASGCYSGPLRFVGGSPATRRPWQLRRYVGTVGGQPATALLRWQNPDSVSGSFYFHRAGAAYTLQPAAGSRPGRPMLAVSRHDLSIGDSSAGRWQLPDRPGAVLRGTWHAATGHRPFVLRESYAGAVRLTIETTYLTGGWSTAWEPDYEGCPHVPTVRHEFLHLSGGRDGVPAALRSRLSPGPAARRRTTQLVRDAAARVAVGLNVQLNDFGLLSYTTTTEYYSYDTGRLFEESAGSSLLDLVGGQAWPLDRLLLPGSWLPVRRLAAWHLRRDAYFGDIEWEWQRASPAAAYDTTYRYESWKQPDLAPRPWTWVLTGAGLELTYGYETLNALNARGWDTVLIPYAELRPLLRPGTPLARMLAARGMW
ncbi:hypothetical protein Q5H93_23355 [Hymenobacter sp. ASUV-10]|uniref:Uncharacterized protein n=1 Tax=Hymenobacter aranciens TaxID=3063996 RepID=A0ABT9BMF1_9BACT|nr:hypothetical protein [Hymenobacter sp. ASUV-10]MDO7877693.1 hypothetical protein [Hymenobacter sp. ASUV-10]